jgi:hypothetical protein
MQGPKGHETQGGFFSQYRSLEVAFGDDFVNWSAYKAADSSSEVAE